MYLLLDLLYFLGTPAAAVFLFFKSRRTGKYRFGWPGRFGFGPDLFPAGIKRPPQAKVLLLHCVSVGELNSVQTLIQRLLAADPQLHIALTTTTDTGTERAKKLYPPIPISYPLTSNPFHCRVHAFRFPLDFSFAVEMLFDRVRPDAIALVELETWPNFLAIAQSRRIPVALINGRLSERSFPRYRMIRPLMKSMLQKLSWIAVQTPTIAERFLALGAPAEKLEILSTLKYDNAQIPDHAAAMGEIVPGQNALARAIGLGSGHRLFVAGSIAPGEEIPLLDTYLALKEVHPNLRLALVPRHPEAMPQMIATIESKKLVPILRTDRPDDSSQRGAEFSVLRSSDVFLLNTMGELRKLYALAFATFIGRSLVNLGGSDMIEAAALAKPLCFGPHTHNFAEVVEMLTKNQAAFIVRDTPTLVATLDYWLSKPADALAQGQKAQKLIRQQQGSTTRYVYRLVALLSQRP